VISNGARPSMEMIGRNIARSSSGDLFPGSTKLFELPCVGSEREQMAMVNSLHGVART